MPFEFKLKLVNKKNITCTRNSSTGRNGCQGTSMLRIERVGSLWNTSAHPEKQKKMKIQNNYLDFSL